jgi:hypothetical protein
MGPRKDSKQNGFKTTKNTCRLSDLWGRTEAEITASCTVKLPGNNLNTGSLISLNVAVNIAQSFVKRLTKLTSCLFIHLKILLTAVKKLLTEKLVSGYRFINL